MSGEFTIYQVCLPRSLVRDYMRWRTDALLENESKVLSRELYFLLKDRIEEYRRLESILQNPQS